jgi:hypothetical protein
MLARITHLLPLTNIRRQRVLPVNGRVLVRTGQKVSATDVIADARLAKDHVLLDVSQGLGISTAQADKLVQRKVGEDVSEGDIIAGPIGLFQRIVRAPQDGRVVGLGNGQVLLELESTMLELRGGIAGVVAELVADRGAIIETQGALLQGVWGNNLIEDGMLTVLARSPEDELTVDRLDVSQRGAIILGGPCTRAEVFRTAAEVPLRALILASITPNLIPVAAKCSIPVLVMEGFGRLPMAGTTYKIISTNEKREICVNATAWGRSTGARPGVGIPLPAGTQIPYPRESDNFTSGQMVKVIQFPYKGQVGTLTSLCPGLTTFSNGVRAPAAMLRLDNGEQVALPLTNLEVIA